MSPASTRTSLSPQVWALLCFLDPLPLSSQPPPEPLEDAGCWGRRSRGARMCCCCSRCCCWAENLSWLELEGMILCLPTRLTFAEFSHLNLSDKMPEHILTSEILLQASLSWPGGRTSASGWGPDSWQPRTPHWRTQISSSVQFFTWKYKF